jgi:membrane-associated protein
MKEENIMDMDFILQIIEDNGYIGLFLWLWLGAFGIPIPNEVIIMTVGFAASMKVLNPHVTFLVTYGGILAALTTSYLLGRYVGRPLMNYFEKRKRFSKKIRASFRLIERYHATSLLISYFIPGIRLFVPFLYGVSRLSFKKFIVFAYTGVLVWLSIMYTIGYFFSDHIDKILSFGQESLYLFFAFAFGLIVLKVVLRKRSAKEEVRHHGPHI